MAISQKIQQMAQIESIKKTSETANSIYRKMLSTIKKRRKNGNYITSNGILGNEIYLREYIKQKGNLFAIVEIPLETFRPNVMIHTSVLFLQKGQKNDNKKLFISINKFCGYDKKGCSIDKDDIRDVSKFYHKNISNENNFFIDFFLLEQSFLAKRYLKKYIDNLNEINKSQYPVVLLDSLIQSTHNGANIEDSSMYVSEGRGGLPYILVKSVTKEDINFENLKYIKKDLIINR